MAGEAFITEPPGESDGQLISQEQNFGGDVKARSAAIYGDPKMKELKHFAKSHRHEVRLREAAELEKRVPSASGGRRANLRSEGCESYDVKLKKLSKEEPFIPYVAKSGELPDGFLEKESQEDLKESMETRMAQLRRTDRFETRLGWRGEMDRSLMRLLVDMDLSRDERLKEFSVKQQATMADAGKADEVANQSTRFAKARCNHLDKIYVWYCTHGMKEVRKERKAPPYLRYNPQDPVMPGSMRVAPPLIHHNKGGMGHSSSSPALLAAGAAATGASSSTA